jgi:nucleoside-diphosphate-sugar epimerase
MRGDVEDPEFAAALPPLAGVVSALPIWLLPAALEAAIDNGARRVVAFSSTSRFTKAHSALAADRAQAAALAEAEEAVQAICQSRGVSLAVLRPTLIYAEGLDANVSRLAALIRRLGFLPLYGPAKGRRQPVHAEDLAWAARTAIAREAVSGCYDLPGGEVLTYRQMAERVFESLGRKPRALSVPPAIWAAAFFAARPLLPGATVTMGSRMAEDLIFDDGPARRDFGWDPRPFRPDFSRSSPPPSRFRKDL